MHLNHTQIRMLEEQSDHGLFVNLSLANKSLITRLD